MIYGSYGIPLRDRLYEFTRVSDAFFPLVRSFLLGDTGWGRFLSLDRV
jgi:hypothetical protein